MPLARDGINQPGKLKRKKGSKTQSKHIQKERSEFLAFKGESNAGQNIALFYENSKPSHGVCLLPMGLPCLVLVWVKFTGLFRNTK